MAQPVNFVTKHPFNGDARQSQLSFPQGATIVAKPGQDGAWWWGSFQGKEGWFPPAYVAPMGPPTPVAGAAGAGAFAPSPQQSMQQRMQQASFAPSVKQQQQQPMRQASPMAAGGFQQQPQPGFGSPQMQQQQQPQAGFGQGPTGFGGGMSAQQQGGFGGGLAPQQPANDDPFAGLEPMNAGGGGAPPQMGAPAGGGSVMSSTGAVNTMSSSRSVGSTGSFGGTGSVASGMSGSGLQAQQVPPPLSMQPQPQQQQAPPKLTMMPTQQQQQQQPVQQQSAIPSPTQVDSAQQALARMGINSPSNGDGGPPPGERSAPARSKSHTSPAASSSPAASNQQQRHRSVSPVLFREDEQPSTPAAKAAPTPAKTPSSAIRPATDPTKTAAPEPISKEEMEQRRLRAQEEERQKAKYRKEKEEYMQMQEQAAEGLGASGFALQQSDSGEVEVGLAAADGSGDGGIEPSFNAYDFLSGSSGSLPSRKFSPIYRVPPFWSLMDLTTYIRRRPLTPEKLADRAGAYQQLSKALSFVCHVVAESGNLAKAGKGRYVSIRGQRGPLAYLRHNHLGCEAAIKLISLLPHSAGASGQALDGLFINFLNVFISLIGNLQPGQQIVVPGGWQQPDYYHLCLYIVRNCGDNRWSFTVCNTGKDGLQYHPSTFDSETGRELKQLAMTVWNIPSERLLDSSFWTLLLRMQVYPSKRNTAEFLYTKLLPALNSQPLRSNMDQGPADYHPVPDTVSAQTYHPLAKLAMCTSAQMGKRPAKYSMLLLMNAAVDLAYAEIENAPPSSLDPEDTRILKLTGRNLSNFASTMDVNTIGDGSLGPTLASTWDLLDKMHKQINLTASKPTDQYSHGLTKAALSDDFSKGHIESLRTDAGSAAHPLFGRLRRDDYENVVRKLMGDPRPDPILIPAVLTDEELPPIATDYSTAASSLQRIADACSLLLQQRRLIKNASAFAASAAQYAMTVILPMPNSDARYCFWRKLDMRRETQLNLLFLIRRICRIYSAATSCVQPSRGLVAIRTITFASAACVADAICRVKAVDDPSTFALHYSGLCEGPTQPFAIEAGSFDTLGSNLPIYDPNLCSLRFRCLDYLRELSVKPDGLKRNTIFGFDNNMTPLEGDLVLINQLSIQLALQRPYPPTDEAMINHAANVISGKNGSIIEVLPEFEYFRDIVFHFKHAVSGKSAVDESTENKAWLPQDATLHWQVKRKEKDDPRLYYSVTAFRDHPQEYVERVAQEPTSATAFKGFLSLFSSKTKMERYRLSSADPTTVVNSCGDKFQKKRAKNVSVRTEDDVLHLENNELPTFGHVLTPSDSEKFVQFLTVPYIRIPLILDFFANGDPGRLSALKSKSLQMIVDAALFEPGRWKPSDFTDFVNEIPIKDFDRLEALLATAHGTLFNEIAKSPDVLCTCIVKMLERALDMDVGKYTKKSSSGPLILYTIRLAVRIEGYLKYALKRCVPGQPRPRGLESLDNQKVDTALKKIRAMLDTQAIPTLEYWIDPSRNKDTEVACLVHAHLLYLFKNYDYEDLDYRAVSIIMSSQVFLTINLRFSSKVYDDLQDTNNPTHPPPSIQIAQSEIFDTIQAHRYNVLRFIREKPEEGDHAMESVVRIATSTGSRDQEIAELKKRHWQSIGHHTCYGRFVPDTEDIKLRDGSYRRPKIGQTYEEWMLYVTTKAVGIEVNVQLSDFTLQNHKMTLLDSNIMDDKDFEATRLYALRGANDVACAEVVHTSNRYWWRLVGRRYDVQSWSPDLRNYYDIKEFKHPKHSRKFPNGLKGGETWIADTLKDKAPLILPGVTLSMSNKDFSDEPYAFLTGWIPNKKGGDGVCTHTLKEVIVYQHPPAISVFNVVEHGRRHFRVLEYTSNQSIAPHEVQKGEPYPDRVGGILSLSAGVPMTTVEPAPSLIVTRALNAKLGTQTYIPPRYLAGLLPTALVEKYIFWQSENDNIIGYEKVKVKKGDDDDDEEDDDNIDDPDAVTSSTRLLVTLAKDEGKDTTGFCNTEAEALIQRIAVTSSDQEVEERDPNRPVLTLLNVLSAPTTSLLKRVGMLLSKLDNLAHVLVWSTSKVESASAPATIDYIELPRVNLTFKAKQFETAEGKLENRLYSNDHDGLFIATSTEAREIADRLLGNISHFIVLQNADNDLFVLMPGCALPRRLHTDAAKLSVQVILDRRNKEWIENIGEVRSYLYPIHNSRSFVVTPSLASSLYLMLMYFITGNYKEVFKMVESCVSEDLSMEEVRICDTRL